jgi:hypothetical protein
MKINDLPDVRDMDDMVDQIENAVYRFGDAYDEISFDLYDIPIEADWREDATEEQRIQRLKDSLAWLEKRIEVFRKETGLNE